MDHRPDSEIIAGIQSKLDEPPDGDHFPECPLSEGWDDWPGRCICEELIEDAKIAAEDAKFERSREG